MTTNDKIARRKLSLLELANEMSNAETQLCWCSDYPHWDMDLPSVIWDLPFLDDRQKRNEVVPVVWTV